MKLYVLWHNHSDKSTKQWSLKCCFWREIFIDAADNFFLGLCLVQICSKLVAIRSTGGNSDFKLILWIENISSTKQSFQLTNIETGALGLTLILSNMSQTWSFIHLGWSCLFSIMIWKLPQHHQLASLWPNYVFGGLVHPRRQKWAFGSFKVKHQCV